MGDTPQMKRVLNVSTLLRLNYIYIHINSVQKCSTKQKNTGPDSVIHSILLGGESFDASPQAGDQDPSSSLRGMEAGGGGKS